MLSAHLSGLRSKDPNTQVGACIINEQNKMDTMGFPMDAMMTNTLGRELVTL